MPRLIVTVGAPSFDQNMSNSIDRGQALIVSATVTTANGSKYVQQLCKHWSHKQAVELSEQKGVVRFPDAVVAFEARADDLSVTIDAPENETVERMKGVVASHLDRFAFREAPLKFDWSEPEVI
jgi:hypothetical protein